MDTIITIGREYGSGGHWIGKLVAEQLGIPLYNKELVDRAAKDSGLGELFFEENDEQYNDSFLFSLIMDSNSFGYASGYMGEMPINEKIFLAEFDAIKALAAEGPCVFVGRCADYVLRDNPNVLSFFIYADLQDRVRRIADIYKISPEEARERIRRTDKNRSSYYNFYTNKEWGKSESYNMCLNSSLFGIDGCMDIIKHAVELGSPAGLTDPKYENEE